MFLKLAIALCLVYLYAPKANGNTKIDKTEAMVC